MRHFSKMHSIWRIPKVRRFEGLLELAFGKKAVLKSSSKENRISRLDDAQLRC
jgi:hypothetical protein